MRNTTHLDNEQFAGWLAGTGQEEAAAHLAQCESCRAEMEGLGVAVGQLRSLARAAAQRPAGFWYAQRQAIAEQIGQRPQPSRLLVWGGAMATLLLMAALLSQAPAPDLQALRASAAAGESRVGVSVDPDDALMREVQASVRRPVPRAFEAALLVTQELHRAAEEMQTTP